MLNPEELIVLDPNTNKDVIATFVSSDETTGVVWAKTGPGNIVAVRTNEILEKNTPENIHKVFANQ